MDLKSTSPESKAVNLTRRSKCGAWGLFGETGVNTPYTLAKGKRWSNSSLVRSSGLGAWSKGSDSVLKGSKGLPTGHKGQIRFNGCQWDHPACQTGHKVDQGVQMSFKRVNLGFLRVKTPFKVFFEVQN